MRIKGTLLIAAVVAALGSAAAQGVGWSNSTLAVLEKGAARGDRNAQLELGKRYEAGDGVPRNRRKAETLYRAAANTSPRVDVLHTPWSNHNASWRVTTSKNNNLARLPEAEERLAKLLKEKDRQR